MAPNNSKNRHVNLSQTHTHTHTSKRNIINE